MAKKESFEQAIARLEEIVVRLESGTEPLDSAMKLFEEGTKLAASCETRLRNARQKLTVLTAEEENEA
ncbi:MAG: exodeoxyribonuclease VII small subunit [Clostridia bacterium]|nr:exodeoxyribonuclease VII small subunit [Clostridia bacterium]